MKVKFSWDANPESNIAGYRIYAGRATGLYDDANSPRDVGNVLNDFFDITAFGTWFFALQAYNTSEVTSGFSSEIQVTINPTVGIVVG